MVEAICADELTNDERHIVELDVCEKVLKRRIEHLGENHPDTLRSISNMFFLYTQLENTESFLRYKDVFDLKMISNERLVKEIANQQAFNTDLQQKYAQAQQDLEIEKISNKRLQEDIVNLQQKSTPEQQEQVKLEVLVTEGSITHEVAGSQSCNVQVPPVLPPPPPPPLLPSILSKKNAPKPPILLKIFNWVKLPDANLQGTVWSKLDCTKWYDNKDFKSIDKLFPASQLYVDGSSKEQKHRAKNITVIDGKRAQNVGIMLKNIKMCGEEISKAILSMDSNEKISIDKLERLLEYTPSDQEKRLLDKHSENIDSLDSADKFLYDISKIHNYEQRLKNILFKKKFNTTVDELFKKITDVKEASREVSDSVRLRKLLELVLAFGNYMSRGPNRNTSGFRLVSLNRLADTKSTVKEVTLLHFVIQVIEKQARDLLELEKDIPHVRLACKVSLDDTVNGIKQLSTGLDLFAQDISVESTDGQPETGHLLPVVRKFHAQALRRFAILEDQFQAMKTSFDKALRLFREDDSVQPDAFFEIFDVFLTAFLRARQDNDNFNKRQEKEEKRAKQRSESSEAKSIGVKSVSKNESKKECDDLESKLRVGNGMSILKGLKKSRTAVVKEEQSTSIPLQRLHSGESGERNDVGR